MYSIPVMYIWLALTVVFIIIEAATINTVTIWFAVGGFAATLAAWLLPDALAVQLAVFLLFTALSMYFTRPLLTKYLTRKTPTNMDMYIGKDAVALSDIAPESCGRAKIGGLSWQARSSEVIKAGETCRVVKIEGASVVVEKIKVNN